MSDREYFIATLQACYFGDRNAFNEIVRIYDKKENIIKEVREYVKENTTSYWANTEETIEGYELVCDPEELLEILDKADKESNS